VHATSPVQSRAQCLTLTLLPEFGPILLFWRSAAASFTPQFLLILKDFTHARLWTAATIKQETNRVSNRSLKFA
jgi:hypothetical protein